LTSLQRLTQRSVVKGMVLGIITLSLLTRQKSKYEIS
jgi:hypothetical protein